jgi:sporulation protein YlmC with PRC-barrel domain
MLSALALRHPPRGGRNETANMRTAGQLSAFTPEKGEEMNLYAIRRRNAWQSAEELEGVGARSKEVADTEFPDDIGWIRTYVLKDEDGTLGSVCIYQATSIEKVREHAKRVGMPADEVTEIADTVIVRPDPQPQAAA